MKQALIWDYYQNQAPETFRGSVSRLAFLANKVKPGAKVLNVGVGAGTFEELALKRGLDVYSLDPIQESVVSLRRHLNLGDNARVGYSDAIPFSDAYFDSVVVSEIIEHLTSEQISGTLREINRVLVADGTVLGTVPASEKLDEQLVVCPDCGKQFHRWGHLQSFDEVRLKDLFEDLFVIENIVRRPFYTFSTLNWGGKSVAVVRSLLWRLGVHGSNESLFFCARKRA